MANAFSHELGLNAVSCLTLFLSADRTVANTRYHIASLLSSSNFKNSIDVISQMIDTFDHKRNSCILYKSVYPYSLILSVLNQIVPPHQQHIYNF